MSGLFKQVTTTSDLGWLGSTVTLVFLGLFVAWTVWAWWPGNREALERASRLPFDDGGDA